MNMEQEKKKREFPHTYVIIFALIVFAAVLTWFVPGGKFAREVKNVNGICLLYTSDAADDLLCVDLVGSRIIKKKKTK